MEGAGTDAGFPTALAAAIRPQALSEYEKALTAVFNAGAEVRTPADKAPRACNRTHTLSVTGVVVRPSATSCGSSDS